MFNIASFYDERIKGSDQLCSDRCEETIANAPVHLSKATKQGLALGTDNGNDLYFSLLFLPVPKSTSYFRMSLL